MRFRGDVTYSKYVQDMYVYSIYIFVYCKHVILSATHHVNIHIIVLMGRKQTFYIFQN